MKKLFYPSVFLFLLFLVIFSCESPDEAPVPETKPKVDQQNAARVLAYIKKLGFAESSIIDAGDKYIVEEDILFSKNLIITEDSSKEFSGGRTKQYYTGHLVNETNRSNIRVMISASMASMTSEITGAISHWNSVPNTSIRFSIVTSGTYDILIVNTDLPGTVCGRGDFAHNGAAGPLVDIDKIYLLSNYSFEQRQRTVIHELGHAIGFRHTNWSSSGEPNLFVENGITYNATNVPGVGGTDASSLMNAGQCGFGATALSTNDRLATAALYPLNATDLYIVKNGVMYVTDQSTGIGLDVNEGFSQTEAMTAIGGYIYAVAGGSLWKVDPANGHNAVPFSDYPDGWADTEAMTSANGYLYAASQGGLWSVNISNGDVTPFSDYPDGWSNTEAMTSSGGFLYAVSQDGLWSVNLSNGDVLPFSDYPTGWSGTEGMASYAGYLYAVTQGSLWKVNLSNGDVELFSNYPTGWEGTQGMTAKNGNLFIIQGGILWKVVISNGDVSSVGTDSWTSTEAMIALP